MVAVEQIEISGIFLGGFRLAGFRVHDVLVGDGSERLEVFVFVLVVRRVVDGRLDGGGPRVVVVVVVEAIGAEWRRRRSGGRFTDRPSWSDMDDAGVPRFDGRYPY